MSDESETKKSIIIFVKRIYYEGVSDALMWITQELDGEYVEGLCKTRSKIQNALFHINQSRIDNFLLNLQDSNKLLD